MRLNHLFGHVRNSRRLAALQRSSRLQACETLPPRALLTAAAVDAGVSEASTEYADEAHEYSEEFSTSAIDQMFASQESVSQMIVETTFPLQQRQPQLFAAQEEPQPFAVSAPQTESNVEPNVPSIDETTEFGRTSVFSDERQSFTSASAITETLAQPDDSETDNLLNNDLSPLTLQLDDRQENNDTEEPLPEAPQGNTPTAARAADVKDEAHTNDSAKPESNEPPLNAYLFDPTTDEFFADLAAGFPDIKIAEALQ